MVRNISDPFGTLLKFFRKRQHLTQQQIAAMLGVHRNTIGRWEDGSFLPESKALVFDLIRQLCLNEHEARQLFDASLITPTPLWSVPYPRNPFFTGRENQLEVLYAHLSPGKKIELPQSYALYGLGGVGKTQLALEYAYRHALEYRAVFWIGAETVGQISISMLRIARQLALPEYGETDHQHIVAEVVRWLEMHSEWLLICDNLEDPALLLHYLPVNRQGALLITTQRHAWGTLAEPLELSPLSKEEGITLLLRRSRLKGAPLTTSASQSVLADAAELVYLLEGLPLALDQAGAYLEETECSLSDYLQRYRGQRQEMLRRRGTDGVTHPASVTTTLQLVVKQVEQYHPAAADLLRLCTFFQVEGIPEELFALGASHLGPVLDTIIDPYRFDLAVAALLNASLLTRCAETRMLSVHRLVQAVLQDEMEPAEVRLLSERVIRVVNTAFPKPTLETWSKCERYLAHALACISLIEINNIDLPEIGELLSKTGNYLLACGRYEEAGPLLESALSWGEQHYGPDHPKLVPLLMSQAELFWKLGSYKAAETLLQRILEVEEYFLEPDHPEMAATLDNLALFCWQWGKYKQAVPLFQRALRIRERHLSVNLEIP